MITATLDTNVIVSAILFGGVPRKTVDLAIAGKYRIASSLAIAAETESVLKKPKFGLTPEFVSVAMRELESLVELCYPKKLHRVVARDPSDNVIVDCAVEANADYIVTGDDQLLSLGSVVGITVLSPSQFLEVMPVG